MRVCPEGALSESRPPNSLIRLRSLLRRRRRKVKMENMSKHSLKGKAVLVGGGAKNLGGLISRAFAADGAKICVHYNSASTKADADKTLAEIKAAGGEAFTVQGDFTKVA